MPYHKFLIESIKPVDDHFEINPYLGDCSETISATELYDAIVS